jgi:hypothetical protein
VNNPIKKFDISYRPEGIDPDGNIVYDKVIDVVVQPIKTVEYINISVKVEKDGSVTTKCK